jgi:citrate synthase
MDKESLKEKILELSAVCQSNYNIDPGLYKVHQVKRGLRDENGRGVITGLTDISEIVSSKDGQPCEGELYYRGLNIKDLIRGFSEEKRHGFEETVYLLMFGKLPNVQELTEFNTVLKYFRKLPKHFVRDVIMNFTSNDAMNSLAKSVLALYSEDKYPDSTATENVMRQCLELVSLFPMLSVYAYQVNNYYRHNTDLIIHRPNQNLSHAENLLHILRPDSKYTELEARVLDIALVLHAEHGGGNNSTFTTHVVTSSGTDTYSAIAAALGSLKGPKHGGANVKVTQMFEDMKDNIDDYTDEDEIRNYLLKLLHKEAFDKAGLIYGMGHAVYSLSDPRADIFKKFVKDLSQEKNKKKEFELYSIVERLAPEVIGKERHIYKGVAANVDFYSGFVYSMLDLPKELYTPIFAIARIAGWSAHRIEELLSNSKIIRPAYISVAEKKPYLPLLDR